jgi:hypothetical protein
MCVTIMGVNSIMIIEVMTNKIANDIIRHQKKFWMSSLYEVFCTFVPSEALGIDEVRTTLF